MNQLTKITRDPTDVSAELASTTPVSLATVLYALTLVRGVVGGHGSHKTPAYNRNLHLIG
jgi:hypothetical protein